MRKTYDILVAILLLLSVTPLSAQITWGEPNIRHLEGDRYRLELTAVLDEGWKMYDMESYVDGPNPTMFSFDLPVGVTLDGGVETLSPATRSWDAMFGQQIGYYRDSVTFIQDFVAKQSGEVGVGVEWMLCSSTSCMPPTDKHFIVDIATSKKGSMWMVILEAMLWGFAALLTPCVFPMVPMTISFFMKGDSGRGRVAALLYGLFIVLLYTLPIAIVIMLTYMLGGDAVTADIFNWVATHWLPNLLFFAIFMLFAASFFGAFEINLPSKWINQSDSRADKGSLVGIFFLALTLVLVSFSCTGPIVGSVLIKSASGEFWQPIITMLAFSAAFALPFCLVALFPSLISRMPRSGGWLGSVKIVLGFLEIALALKFLSVADQTYHWGLLSRELYLAIWIVVFTLLGLFLLGKLHFAHSDRVESVGVVRLFLSIVVFSFVIYISTGLWGAPLSSLAGYLPPPTQSQIFMPTGADAAEQPAFTALDEAQLYANSVNKPLLVDFTGYGCVNCREMEQRVWSDPRVAELLRDEYVVVPLYMDDKRELPESDWVTTSSGRVLKSVGRINSHLALSTFGVNSQPYYILLGRDGEELVEARGYNLDVDAYIEFLERGLRRYHSSN